MILKIEVICYTDRMDTINDKKLDDFLAPANGEDITPEHRAWMNDQIRQTLAKIDAGEMEFAPNKVIAGWTEAMQLMKEGDKWELYIPSDLAYGNQTHWQSGALSGELWAQAIKSWQTSQRVRL